MIKKILNFSRIINKKTFNIQLFLIPTHIRVKIQIFFFCFFPNFINLLSAKGVNLPKKNERFVFNSNKLNECIILNKRNFKEKKIKLFIRSKKKNYSKFKDKKIFLLNPLIMENETKNRHINMDETKIQKFKGKRFIYVSADHTIVEKFIKANVNILYVQTWKKRGKKFYLKKEDKPIYKNILEYCKNKKNCFVVDIAYNTTAYVYASSAVAAACFFAKSCQKVNIYNWGFYLKNTKNFSFFKIVNLLYPLGFRIKNNIYLEISLWHWYFIYRLVNLKNVSITGNLKTIAVNKKIVMTLKKIFCK